MTDNFTIQDNNNNDVENHNQSTTPLLRKGKYRGDRGVDHIKRTIHSNSLQNLKQNQLKVIAENDVGLENDDKNINIQENETTTINNISAKNPGKWVAIGFAVFIICIVLWLLWLNHEKKKKEVLFDDYDNVE